MRKGWRGAVSALLRWPMVVATRLHSGKIVWDLLVNRRSARGRSERIDWWQGRAFLVSRWYCSVGLSRRLASCWRAYGILLLLCGILVAIRRR